MSYRLLLTFIAGSMFISCYTRKEGCLDRLASNYDVTSDDECNNCCKFPILKLTISHMAGDSAFSTSDTFTNNFNQKYVIQDIRYYVSDFSVFQGDSTYQIREKIATEGGEITIANDMKILRSVDKTIDIGTIRAYSRFDSLKLRIGLTPVMTNNVFSNLPTTHVLLKNYRLKDSTGNFAHFTMKYQRIKPLDTISKLIVLPTLPEIPYSFINKIITTKKGEDMNFAIKADYLRLLQNVDLSLPSDQIVLKIKENIKGMITVK